MEICHLQVENSSGLQVDIDKVIWTIPADHNDEMEMRVNGAMLVIHIDDVNRSVNNRSTVTEAAPQSLSFYTMFYKIMIENR